MPTVKIAALQMVSGPHLEANLDRAEALMAQAAEAGAHLVVLPEYFCLMGQRDADKLVHAEPLGPEGQPGGPIQRRLAETARRCGLWVVGGTLPQTGLDAGHVFNTCCVIGPDGVRLGHYDKIHLFGFDNGRERYDESRVLHAGRAPSALTLPGLPGAHGALRVGLSICYDLRFPELYRAMMTPPCDLIAVPAAFTHTTGLAHWMVLLRARAIENQCYVIASAQGGVHPNGRRTFGHSCIIDPWGQVLAHRPDGEGVVMAALDTDRLSETRQHLPALRHRVLA